MALETSVSFLHLMRLITQEDFIVPCRVFCFYFNRTTLVDVTHAPMPKAIFEPTCKPEYASNTLPLSSVHVRMNYCFTLSMIVKGCILKICSRDRRTIFFSNFILHLHYK